MKKRKVVVSKRHLDNARELLKIKKFKCSRCGARFEDNELLKEHKQDNHGDYDKESHLAVKNSKDHKIYKKFYMDKQIKPTPKPKREIPFVRISIYKKSPHKDFEDNPNECYLVNDEIRWIQPYVNKEVGIVCKNCLHTTHMTNEIDFILCPFCGLILYEDNRKTVYNWLISQKRKSLKGIREDVINSIKKVGETNDLSKMQRRKF